MGAWVSWILIFRVAKQWRRQDFGGGGDIGQNFIHEFLSSPVLQWRRQNFGSGDIQQKCTHQRHLKNLEKFIKNLHKNLKNFPKFFKNKI